LDGGSGIPSLTVVSGNGEVSLQWDEVPGAETYTLYYTTDNSYPNVGHGGSNGFEMAGVDPGLTLPNLQNGAMHVFQLRAELGEALPDAWSDFVQALPLSEFSLAPRVSTAVPDQIEIFWKSIPADVPFVLYRSDSADGTYYQLTEPIYGTSYVDWNVTDGQVYHYRVAPLAYSDTMSFSAVGTTGLIPNESLVSSATPTEYSACSVWIEGNYAYVSTVGGCLLIFGISETGSLSLVGSVDILSIYPPRSYTGPLPPNIVGVAVYEDYAFLGNWTDDSIYVIDVSSAEDPVVKGSFLTANGPVDIDVYERFLISLEYDYISAFDIADVASWLPAEPAQFSYPCTSREYFQGHSAKPLRGSCMDIDAASGMTYIGTMHRDDPSVPQTMHVVVENVNSEGTLTWVAESTDLDCDAMADIAVSDDGAALYVAMGPYGVQVMDSSTLALVDEIDSQGTAVGVNAVGDSLYVVGLGSGLEVYDIPDPLDPDPLPTRIFESNTSCYIKAHPVYDNGFIFYPDLVSGLQRIYVLDDFLYDDPAETGLYSLYPATSNNKAFDVAVT
ncbi:MAG: hypothetical protein KAU31_13830, partial [Spirochaetaceae bacterium]|nr:hypothetical protein [Spirochaetaceae bacterium]